MNIHRANLNGKPACGATYGRISNSGASVTCPDCKPMDVKEAAAQVQAAIEAAAARFRASQPPRKAAAVFLGHDTAGMACFVHPDGGFGL